MTKLERIGLDLLLWTILMVLIQGIHGWLHWLYYAAGAIGFLLLIARNDKSDEVTK